MTGLLRLDGNCIQDYFNYCENCFRTCFMIETDNKTLSKTCHICVKMLKIINRELTGSDQEGTGSDPQVSVVVIR